MLRRSQKIVLGVHTMNSSALRYEGPGPFRAEDLRPRSRYELHDGHPGYCPPADSDRARRKLICAEMLDSDPVVEEAGIDPGYAPQQLEDWLKRALTASKLADVFG